MPYTHQEPEAAALKENSVNGGVGRQQVGLIHEAAEAQQQAQSTDTSAVSFNKIQNLFGDLRQKGWGLG
jgi:hypothetical protein